MTNPYARKATLDWLVSHRFRNAMVALRCLRASTHTQDFYLCMSESRALSVYKFFLVAVAAFGPVYLMASNEEDTTRIPTQNEGT
jgi:hypothetical protein